MLTTAVVFANLSCMCTGAFLLFYGRGGQTFAESASYAIVSVFMLLSFIRQVSFITGISIISDSLELLFLVAAFILIIRHRSYMLGSFGVLKRFGSSNPTAFVFLGFCFLYMIIHAFSPVPKEFSNELYNLSVVAGKGILPPAVAAELSALLPINHLILFKPLFGFGTIAFARAFCFLAYLSIGFSTYALARRYSWPPTAFTSAILVMSMPRLVVQAIIPGSEIISIAVTLFCILTVYRCVELPHLTDLIFLVLGLFFCISENISSMIFVPILFVLSCVILFRRHGIIEWKSIIGHNYFSFLAVLPAVVFSQTWLFLSNHLNNNPWFGAFSSIPFNKDGIQGALANFIRYIFESLYFTAPVEIFFEKIFKRGMIHSLESFYDFCVRPFLGEMGAAQVFHLSWMPDEMFSFGPVGFFLVLPALFYALLKGPRRLKAVAIGFFVYFYLVSLVFAWAPGNAKFLEIFYVCSGFTIAFFFPPWRLTKRNNKILQAGGCLVLFLTLLTAL